MSALTPTGGAGGAYDLFNFGFGTGTKNEGDQGGPWSTDWGQQPHPPTPQTLRHLLAETASRALFDNGQQQEQLMPQLLQQQQQQQPFYYSPTPPGQFAGRPHLLTILFSFFLVLDLFLIQSLSQTDVYMSILNNWISKCKFPSLYAVQMCSKFD